MDINGVLLLYHLPLTKDAPTILENVRAYGANSRFKVWNVNTHLGFPASLAGMHFSAIVFHYSLFGNWPFRLRKEFLDYLSHSDSSYRVAFFQDEFQYCQERFDFLNRCRVDCVYTLIEPRYFEDVYGKCTSVSKIIHHLTGYVSDELIGLARRLTLPDQKRAIDVGYRARSLPFYMGRGAQEKSEIGIKFRELAAGRGLRLNIGTEESSRIYGNDWYKFVANCRGMIGTEAGVSITDIDGQVRAECERLLRLNPRMTFTEMSNVFLHRWEDRIPQRVISPRHFEAAAFRVCQILFEGKYSGVMQPMVHYLPLKKDFSNFDQCMRLFEDGEMRRDLTENAYRDLIASGQYSYRSFILEFDNMLLAAGLNPEAETADAVRVTKRLNHDRKLLEFRTRKNMLLYRGFPGRRALALVGGPVLRTLRRLKGKMNPEVSV